MDMTLDASTVETDSSLYIASGHRGPVIGHQHLETAVHATLSAGGTVMSESESESESEAESESESESESDETTEAEYQYKIKLIAQMLRLTLAQGHHQRGSPRLILDKTAPSDLVSSASSASTVHASTSMYSAPLTLGQRRLVLWGNMNMERSVQEYKMEQEPFLAEATGHVYFGRHVQNTMGCIMIKVLEMGSPKDYEGDARGSDAKTEIQILTTKLPRHDNIIHVLGMTHVRFWLQGLDDAAKTRSTLPNLIFRYHGADTLAEYILENIRRNPLIEHEKAEIDSKQEQAHAGATVVELTPIPSFSLLPSHVSDSDLPPWLLKTYKEAYPVFPKLKHSHCIRNAIYLRDLLRALAHLKKHHILHRNVNPFSVTVVRANRHFAMLGNFAFAVDLQNRDSTSDHLTIVVGAAEYRAPELLKYYEVKRLERKLGETLDRLSKLAHDDGMLPKTVSTADATNSNVQTFPESMEQCQAEQMRLVELSESMRGGYTYSADIWSIAMIMIELFMGVSPFFYSGRHGEEMYSFIQNNLLAPTGTTSSALSPYLSSVRKTMDNDDAFEMLLAMLQENPNDRPTPEVLLEYPYFNCLSNRPNLAE